MQLDDFIKNTLIQIAAGVSEASKEVKELGGLVNPANEHKITFSEPTYSDANTNLIKFDVSLSVIDSNAVEGNGKAKIAVISIGGGTKSIDSTTFNHRVQFSIPMNLPTAYPDERR